jgi:hypothetical protein
LRTRSAVVGPDGPVLGVKGVDYNMQNDPILAAFGITPSPHRRTTAPSLLLAFAHVHGEAGTPSLRTRSAVVGPNGPVLGVKGVDYNMQNDPILAAFGITPSPHRRTTAPSLLLAFAHIQDNREHHLCAPGVRWWFRTVRFCVWKGCFSMPFISVCGRVAFQCKTPPFLLHSASPRLCTVEPQHLVCFWPSPTSMARREHHLCAPEVRRWVRTVRFCVWKGCILMQNEPILAAFGITPSLHR